MTRCAGVQKLSRPIDMCHEISQYRPNIEQAGAKNAVHTNHGIEATPADVVDFALTASAIVRCRELACVDIDNRSGKSLRQSSDEIGTKQGRCEVSFDMLNHQFGSLLV